MRPMFISLRHRNYRLWATADLISITGTWMQVLAVNWLVLSATGSATRMGLTVLLQALPVLVIGPYAGALADRLESRHLLVVTQSLHALLCLALAGVAATDAPLSSVYALSFLAGVVTALEGPAMGRFASRIVGRDALGNALALGSLINSTGRIAGMSLGGILVAVVGPAVLFLLNALSFGVVVLALLAIRTADLHPLAISDTSGTSGIREGLRYLRTERTVLVVLALAVILGSLGRNYQVTMAAMAAGPLDAGGGGYGMLSTVFAIGTVIGALLAARIPVLSYRLLILAGLATSVLQVVSAAAPGVVSFAAVILLIAAGAVIIDTTVSTRAQLDTREEMRGRVLSALGVTSSLAGMLGAPLLGALSETLGARGALLVGGVATTLACLAAGAALQTRRRRNHTHAESPSVPQRARHREPVPA